ncbi:expressed unknown protein [Ectocarpus siliculosus]|uniref:Mediator of RNA polymerase II transcription subunit 10 n=1 Tax=Ectocarpus siliculosus TaxID=2880 RepID=D8LG04_ECTSI|nr:expressed unknown protein [Ectocarpus siliculosus]|eukprot:CBN78903.1 expressed unknown protein [Ectocarpus siliculosus]
MSGDQPQPDPGTKALLGSLESVVMDLNDMENMIENFEESAAESFFSKMNEYITNLKKVEEKAPGCQLHVPREALERIDDDVDQNPELFAQELLARCKDESGQLSARVLGIKKVRQTVMEGWRTEGSGPVNGATPSAGGAAVGPNGAAALAHGRAGSAQKATAEGAEGGGVGVLPKGVGGKGAPGYSSSSSRG